eukprot:6124307-Ditylum_brightwellii.AAC.1
MDDTYMSGQPDVVIATVPTHRTRLNEVGLDFSNTKTACYIGPSHRNNRYHCMLGEMDKGMLQTKDGLPAYGLKIYGVPIRDADYIKEALSMKATKI